MRKRIKDMTPADKASFLAVTIRSTEEEQGVPWSWMERKIQEDIDATFDDEAFARMNPDFAIDAAYARQYFGKDNKPALVDYLLWSLQFVTKSDVVEW